MRPLNTAPLLRQESVSLEITNKSVVTVIPELGLERQDTLTTPTHVTNNKQQQQILLKIGK